ncbi:MAG: TraM recognition domain-containing protein, partial [Sediminibacterium sp.]|nr:TraM recognition domain-containing protein [Sediminibacterium sp.]
MDKIQLIIIVSIIILIIVLIIIGIIFNPKNSFIKDKKTTEKTPNFEGIKIPDIFAGVCIMGAAGSGKTRGVLAKLFQHYGKYNFSNIIYCYKTEELLTLGLPIINGLKLDGSNAKDLKNIYIIAPGNPEYTMKINLLDPDNFSNVVDIRSFFEIIIKATKGDNAKSSNNPFFDNAVLGAMVGLAYLFINEAKIHPEFIQYCNFAHFMLTLNKMPLDDICTLLSCSSQASAQSKTLLESRGSKETLSNIQSSIANVTGIFSNEIFLYCFYDENNNYVKLVANDDKKTFYLVNHTQNERVVIPILDGIIRILLSRAQSTPENKRVPTSLILDEAPTLSQEGLSQIPATMRSYKISTVYMLQDWSLVDQKTGGNQTGNAINANLSTQFIGKINDTGTSKKYEELFSWYKEKKVSKNFDNKLFGGNTGGSISEEEKREHKAIEFHKLKTGEFFLFSEGNTKKIELDYKNVQQLTSDLLHKIKIENNT